MSAPNEDIVSSHSQILVHCFDDLLNSIIVDVASECHRVAKLGLDRNYEDEEEELKLSSQARTKAADPTNSIDTTSSKYVVDIFGQTHPPVASEIFECMNCGRSIMAGRFAPHLEKCMGKGRKARLKATTRSSSGGITSQNNKSARGNNHNHVVSSTYSPYSTSSSTSNNRLPNGTSNGIAGEESINGGNLEEQ